MTAEIAQLIDTAGNLPRDIIDRFNIKEVPIYYTLDGEQYYLENVNYDTADFYRYMQQYPQQLPKTAAPNINDWLLAFEERYQKGYRQIITTTISAKFSTTHQNACMAKKCSVRNMQYHIKPVCELANGIVTPIKAIRGRRKSLSTIADIAVSRIKDPEKSIICMQFRKKMPILYVII